MESGSGTGLKPGTEVHAKTPDIRVILNPAAAKGKAAAMLPRIKRLMDKHHLNYDVVTTEKPWQAAEAAEEAARAGCKMVVAAGGDGTCNEVVNGLMSYRPAEVVLQESGSEFSARPALAVFPIGRGNDFAYSLNIPKTVEEAVGRLVKGRIRQIDVGHVRGGDVPEGRFFINGLGVGFEPLVNLVASKYTRLSGVLSYLVALVHIMRNYPEAVPIRLSYGDNRVDVKTQQISVCNGRRMGGAFLLGPDALVDDGKLDLCYVNQPVKGSLILYLVTRFFRGTQKSHEKISDDLVEQITISTIDESKRLICHVDGEMISTGTDTLNMEVWPGALDIIA